MEHLWHYLKLCEEALDQKDSARNYAEAAQAVRDFQKNLAMLRSMAMPPPDVHSMWATAQRTLMRTPTPMHKYNPLAMYAYIPAATPPEFFYSETQYTGEDSLFYYAPGTASLNERGEYLYLPVVLPQPNLGEK